MGFLSAIEGEFTKVKDKVSAILPADWVTKFGTLAHTFAANILHDAEAAAQAGIAEAKLLGAPLLISIEQAIEQEAATLAPAVLSGKTTLTDAVTQGVANLTSVAATSIVPGLKVIGEATLTTILRTFAASAVAALGASPTAPPASSSAGSSQAPSKA